MYRDTTYKEKMAILKEWGPVIFEEIKRDLKNEHIKQDYVFAKKYLGGKPAQRLTLDELVTGYLRAVEEEEQGEKIAEFIANRWMMKSSDVYGLFEKELTRINPEFNEIVELPENEGDKLIEQSVKEFGAAKTYLFAVINSVSFSKKQFEALRKKAEVEKKTEEEALTKLQETASFEQLKKEFESKLVKMEEKYEKRLQGLEKKYVNDTASLKKQIANMSRKLNA